MKIKIARKILFVLIVFCILHLPITIVLMATFPCILTLIVLIINIAIIHLLYYATKELL